ncbi:MAG: nuclear transport factor 2 family protein [Luteimonas sp.]|nr:nuclear transport factor 2 family protein [Luteimonas sp.]
MSASPQLMTVHAARGAENKLYRLNADYVAAFLASDIDWFERHLASDFRCILADGGVIDRAAFLSDTARPVAMKSFDVEDVNVQVEGEVAIVQARTVYERADGGRGESRYTEVWIGREGRWQTLLAQITPVVPA